MMTQHISESLSRELHSIPQTFFEKKEHKEAFAHVFSLLFSTPVKCLDQKFEGRKLSVIVTFAHNHVVSLALLGTFKSVLSISEVIQFVLDKDGTMVFSGKLPSEGLPSHRRKWESIKVKNDKIAFGYNYEEEQELGIFKYTAIIQK